MVPFLATSLLTLFAKGEISAATVQTIASSARKDGWKPNDRLAHQLANAGSGGANTGHIHRDVIRAARKAGLMSSGAQPYRMDLPDGTFLDIFLPHEAYYHMVQEHGLEAFCLTEAQLQEPLGLKGVIEKWAKHRDVNISDGDVPQLAAIGLHCDGVPYTNSVRPGGSKSVFVCSMNVVSAADDKTRANRQPLFNIQKARVCGCSCGGYHTLDLIFEVLVWSFECLAAGTTPSRRHDGTEFTASDKKNRLAAGLSIPRAGLMQVRGDWEFDEAAFQFRSVNSNEFCWKCDATKARGDRYAYDFGPAAGHRATAITHERYLASCLQHGSTPSALFRAPGFDIEYIVVDPMHDGDLGVFADAVGSLLWIEVQHKQWHKSAKKGVKALNVMLEKYHQAGDKKRPKLALTLSQIKAKRDPPYPCLKAKAAETRYLAEFADTLAHLHSGHLGRAKFKFHRNHPLAGKEEVHLKYLLQMTGGMMDYHASCAASPFSPADCRTAMYSFLHAFKALHDLWRSPRMMTQKQKARAPFHLRPKAHMMTHLVDRQLDLFGSPNRCWCYRDEDFVGAVKTIAARSSHPSTLECRVCEKLMLLGGLHARV